MHASSSWDESRLAIDHHLMAFKCMLGKVESTEEAACVIHDEWVDHNLRGLLLGANSFFADAVHNGLLLEATAPRLSARWGIRGISGGPMGDRWGTRWERD
jgi:hypothetical protein